MSSRRTACLVATLALLASPVEAAQRHTGVSHPPTGQRLTVPREQAAGSTNWPQFGFDAEHTWFNRFETTLNASNVGQLVQAWSFSTGANNPAGNVIEADGVVYSASQNGTVYAISAATGTRLWSFAAGSGYSSSGSSPVVDHDLIFTVCNISTGTQGICALQASDGTMKWSYAVPGATTFAESPPVVSGGVLYFGGCGTACAYVALKERTGKVLWSAAEPSGCLMSDGTPPAVYNGVLYASTESCDNTNIIAIDAKTGAQLWNMGLSTVAFTGMTVTQDRIAVSTLSGASSNFVYVLSTQDGGVYWSTGGSSSVQNPAYYTAVAKGIFYAPTLGGLIAFKLKIRGDFRRIYFAVGGQQASAAIANGLLFSLYLGEPFAQSAYQPGVLWDTSGPTNVGVPIVVNGTVYGACQSTNVCAWVLPPPGFAFR